MHLSRQQGSDGANDSNVKKREGKKASVALVLLEIAT
jgi:hypothetical protein